MKAEISCAVGMTVTNSPTPFNDGVVLFKQNDKGVFNMNQLKINALLGLATLTTVASVSAHAGELKPYIGLDAGIVNAQYGSISGVNLDAIAEERFKVLNPYVGVELNDKLALELGYFRTSEEDKDLGTVTTSIRFSGIHLDAVGSLPVNDKLDVLGTVGLAHVKAEIGASGTVTGSGSDTEIAPRVGIGARYALSDKVSARAMLRYTKTDFDGEVDGLMQYGVGVAYHF